jgi:hypothetical protein
MDDRRGGIRSNPQGGILLRALYWCAVGALAAAAAWIVTWEAPNPDFDKAMTLRAQLALLDDDRADQRSDLQYELRQVLNRLDPLSRQRVMRWLRYDSQQRRQRVIDRFFDLPNVDQVAELDHQIDEMEARRRAWEQTQREAKEPEATDESPSTEDSSNPHAGQTTEEILGAELSAISSNNTSDAAPPAAPTHVVELHHNSQASESPGEDASPSEPSVPPRPFGSSFLGGRRSLDNLTSEQRERRQEFYRMLDERRTERGLPNHYSAGP